MKKGEFIEYAVDTTTHNLGIQVSPGCRNTLINTARLSYRAAMTSGSPTVEHAESNVHLTLSHTLNPPDDLPVNPPSRRMQKFNRGNHNTPIGKRSDARLERRKSAPYS